MTETLFQKENPTTPEAIQTIPLALLLDVDGVLTDPTYKEVLQPEIFNHLENHMQIGNAVTLNTGRSNEWMIKRIIKPLGEKVSNKSILTNFFAVGEKGLTWISFDPSGNLIEGFFDRNGELVEGFDKSVFLDKETVEQFNLLETETKELVKRPDVAETTFFDSSKKAMISTEMHDKYPDHKKYADNQIQFTAELKRLIQKAGLEDEFDVDPTTIATDIQLTNAGKHLGAKRILDWLGSKNIAPQHFVAFGDSDSDLAMADELASQGKSVDFFYVKPEKELRVVKTFPIEISTMSFGEGTVEMFQKLESRKPSYKLPTSA